MTFYIVLLLSEKYEIDIYNTCFMVNQNHSNVIGTSANLKANSWLTVIDLLYAMMLPSGNDSA